MKRLMVSLLLAFSTVAVGTALAIDRADAAGPDPAKVVGPAECGECHKDEVAVWQATKHYKSFYELSRAFSLRVE